MRKKVGFLVLSVIAAMALAANSALAHSFNVALVIPLSHAAEIESAQIVDGFMLATTERDAHPDQESDGHLGGLDVYVTVIRGAEDVAEDLERNATRGEADIVVAFGPEETQVTIGKLLEGKKVVLLLPGQSPFSDPDSPAVAAFVSAYERAYGSRPTPWAAQGYNAARRIDAAVRAQGGVDDRASLLRSFGETESGFTW